MCKYIVVKSKYECGDKTRTGYGIAVIEECDGTICVLDTVSDLCLDAEPVEELVELCNSACLDPIHLHDIASDFLERI